MHLIQLGRRARQRAAAVLTTALLAGGAVLAAPAAHADVPTFSDVDASNQFQANISWMVENGIVRGYDDGTFRPTAAVSRQAFAAFLARYTNMYGGEFDEYVAPTDAVFSDVQPGHPFHREISYLVEWGVIGGFADGTFRPDAPVSRQAASAFLTRLFWEDADLAELAEYQLFTDVPAFHQFAGPINMLVASDVVTGWPDGTFRPTAPVSRQAVSAFLNRFDTEITQELLAEQRVALSVPGGGDEVLAPSADSLFADAIG